MSLRDDARSYFESLQDRICAELERVDRGNRFAEDRWSYRPSPGKPSSGGGITRVLAADGVFEKAGVNTSALQGMLSDKLADRLGVPPREFFAAGISLVLHPRNPHVPTCHMNLRHIEMEPDPAIARPAWFGGGADLTPYYLDREDARHFHGVLKQACDAHDPDYYPRFKRWCDEYFYIKHRGEARGVGGIFFDYLHDDLERTFEFVRAVGDRFLDAYVPIVERHRHDGYGERQRDWQLVRRGRYVEFNLVYDRGTLFGLETEGRTESILMSLPPSVRWQYDHRPDAGSPEHALLEVLREPVDWTEPDTGER